MKPILLTFIFVLSALYGSAQRVSYPPAPASIYKPYKKSPTVSSQLKSTLWSNNVSDINEWSFTNSSVPNNDWFVDTDSSVISVSGPFQSATSSNGFLVFKSDTSQAASSDAYAEYSGTQIDLTGEPNIRIQFNQQFISDSNQRIVEVSQDGITWTPFVISDGVSPSGEKIDDLASIDISSVAGNANDLHFRFHFAGTHDGYWAIDDVQLRSIDSVDLRAVSLDWGTTGAWGVKMPYYSVIPSQVQPIEFCAVVANDGLLDIDSAVYEVEVSPSSFVSSESFSMQAGSMDTVCLSTPFLTNGYWIYTADQSVNANQLESNILNNEFDSFQFREDSYLWSTYARDDLFTGVQGGIVSKEDLGLEYSVGNVFDVFTYEYVTGIKVHIHPDAQPGFEVVGILYQFDQNTEEWVLVNQTIGYTIYSGDIGLELSLYFADAFPSELEPNSTYLVMVGSYSPGDSSTLFATSGKSKPNTSFYTSSWDPNDPGLSYLTETPMVRLWFDPESLNEHQLNLKLSIAPNPSNESTQLSFELPSSSEVRIDLIDLSGKSIRQLVPAFCLEGKNQIQLNTEVLQNGVYFVKLTTDFGSATKRIIIQH